MSPEARDGRFFPQRPARTSQRDDVRRKVEEELTASLNAPASTDAPAGPRPSGSVVPPTKPASQDSGPPPATRTAKVAVLDASDKPTKAEKTPTANELLEVASAKKVTVVAPSKKDKPKTAKEALRLRAEQSKRGAPAAKKADKTSAATKDAANADGKGSGAGKGGAGKVRPDKASKAAKARDEEDDDPPSLTKRSEDVARATDPPAKLGFWGRVKKLLGG